MDALRLPNFSLQRMLFEYSQKMNQIYLSPLNIKHILLIEMISKKEQKKKDLTAIMGKDIGGKNPIFSPNHIQMVYDAFINYADPRQKRADLRDILLTSTSLGFDEKFLYVFKLLEEINENNNGNALDFEQFLQQLTDKIGNPFTEQGRKANFNLLDYNGNGDLSLPEMMFMNRHLNYGYSEEELQEIVHQISGFSTDSINQQTYSNYIRRRVEDVAKRRSEANTRKRY